MYVHVAEHLLHGLMVVLSDEEVGACQTTVPGTVVMCPTHHTAATVATPSAGRMDAMLNMSEPY